MTGKGQKGVVTGKESVRRGYQPGGYVGIGLKFWFFRQYWWLLIVAFLLLAIIIVLLARNLALVLTLLSTVLSLFYFLQKQRLEETKLFREIFADCNTRYDKLNEKLNAIVKGPEEEQLNPEQKDTLMDYFNLCGEEYLYYSQGYLYPEVWRAWYNGMKYFFGKRRIAEAWSQENQDSYYGLPL
ncbi:MAG: hypothetical protein HY313_04345 [Acidobacteria bacterium]|nr:hypothetical protein [Acidobacteriota bacterium]